MSIEAKYTVSSTATGAGRNGHVSSAPGYVDADLHAAKELGGDGQGTNPEELFSAGYAGCFLGALQAVAGKTDAQLPDETSVEVQISIGKDREAEGFALAATIIVNIPGFDRAEAEKLAQDTHKFCPYSKATQGNIDHTITVNV